MWRRHESSSQTSTYTGNSPREVFPTLLREYRNEAFFSDFYFFFCFFSHIMRLVFFVIFTFFNIFLCTIFFQNRNIHILGSFQNIQIARTAICSLILGSPPSKVYGNMRAIAARSTERLWCDTHTPHHTRSKKGKTRREKIILPNDPAKLEFFGKFFEDKEKRRARVFRYT